MMYVVYKAVTNSNKRKTSITDEQWSILLITLSIIWNIVRYWIEWRKKCNKTKRAQSVTAMPKAGTVE